MGGLSINLDDARIIEVLSEMASRHGQSVEAEVRALLASAVDDYCGRQARVRLSREIRAMTPLGVPQTPAVDIIAEMREERMRDLGY